MTEDLIQTPEYRDLITELKRKVHSAQIKAALKVNEELIGLYWEIGKLIVERQKVAHWGDEIIAQIAKDLTHELADLKGFSRANLYRMKRFYGYYAEQGEFVAQLVRQIPWGHNILMLQTLDLHKQRVDFYFTLASVKASTSLVRS